MFMKFVKVVEGVKSNASGFEYKIDEVNVANNWDKTASNPKDMGGFNYSTSDKILRWLHRGDTLYDVIIPEDSEVVECESINNPHSVFRSNKIIITNPRIVTEDLVIELYKESNMIDKAYYQCLVTLLFKKHIKAVKYIINDRINRNNIDECIKEFEDYISTVNNYNGIFDYNKLWDDAKEIYNILVKIRDDKNKL